jgi:hypothetical protein
MTGKKGISPTSREEEAAELEAVANELERSPRLSSLVRFLGEKYFAGEGDQLNEYNIATEVFGRSKTEFDAGEDAIARVEAHRLRKRIKEFYETRGKDRAIRLAIPSGSYVPSFVRQATQEPPPPSVSVRGSEEQPSDIPPGSANGGDSSGHHPPVELPPVGVEGKSPPHLTSSSPVSNPLSSIRLNRGWLFLLSAVLLIAAAFGIFRALHSPATAGSGDPGSTPVPAAGAVATQTAGRSQPPPPGAPALPVRILAGYDGPPQIDSAGALWGPDRFFYGGGVWRRPATFLYRTSDPMLFDRWRTGDFFYNIPLAPGAYELHLFFVTSDRDSDNAGSFTVAINGIRVLPGFEVISDAMGDNVADERVFRDVSPDKDGYLRLGFTGERGSPALCALEVLPGIPHKQLPIRLVMQRNPYTDPQGRFWHPDNYYMNGRLSTQRQAIADSPDPELFASERFGHFSYAIPVDTRDRYTLVLHFSEFYFGPRASGSGGVGSRLFRVMCNGVALLDDFDIFKDAGSLHLLTKTFTHIKPSAQGKLNLTFEPVVNNATVSGIEVIDESQ